MKAGLRGLRDITGNQISESVASAITRVAMILALETVAEYRAQARQETHHRVGR